MIRNVLKKIIKFLFKIKLLKSFVRQLYLKRLLKFPSSVQPEIINACNANCIMCPHSRIKREIGEMDFGLYKKIIDECSKGKPKAILPFLNGEPLLNPQLINYIRYAKEKNKKSEIAIFTNASLLNEKMSLEILNSGLDRMVISFDGCHKETYEKIRRGLNFDIVNNNVLRFFQLRKEMRKRKPQVSLVIIKMKETEKEIKEFFKKWKKWADSVSVDVYKNWGGEIKGENENETADVKRFPCVRLWYQFAILRDGGVPICCLDYDGKYTIGSIKENTIREIWHGERINNYRNLHLKKLYREIPICKNCNGWMWLDAPFWWWEE